MGRFPGLFLRRTELIKRSLRLDDEPTWWCREPLQAGLCCGSTFLVHAHQLDSSRRGRTHLIVTNRLGFSSIHATKVGLHVCLVSK